MRRLLSTLFASLLITVSAQAQLVINEIMYNIPGNGEDQEYIELHNAGNTAIMLNGHRFTSGIVYDFPIPMIGTGAVNIMLAPGDFYVLALDSAAYHTAFGMAPDVEWTSGSLSNAGEAIVLVNNAGNVVDSVFYDDVAPWNDQADGDGFSLQLCDATTDNNDGANWGISRNYIGMNTVTMVDSLFGTPGMANTCIVILPPSYPLYTIDQIDGIDANGVADSTGVTCELRGIAHCVNFNDFGGYDFRLANSNNVGIRIFSGATVDGYVFAEGDSLHLKGEITQFNGNLQFEPDSIRLISSGNMTVMPMTVTTLDESTENKYVQLLGMSLVDPAQWVGGPGNTSSFNVDITSGNGDTLLMRVDNSTSLSLEPAPMGTFSIAGWGGQFDFSSPYNEGYQILPCGAMQLVNVTQPNAAVQTRLFPNPASTVLTVESSEMMESIVVYNALGQIVLTQNNVADNSIQLNTASLDNGVYTISIVAGKTVTAQLFRVAK